MQLTYLDSSISTLFLSSATWAISWSLRKKSSMHESSNHTSDTMYLATVWLGGTLSMAMISFQFCTSAHLCSDYTGRHCKMLIANFMSQQRLSSQGTPLDRMKCFYCGLPHLNKMRVSACCM